MATTNPRSSILSRGTNYGTMSAYDLIMKLDQEIPHRCIGVEQTPENAQRYAGKRDLVDSLLARLKVEER